MGTERYRPAALRTLVHEGVLSEAELAGMWVDTLCKAMAQVERPVLAHLFAGLRGAGVTLADIPEATLDRFIDACVRSGAIVEVNERWQAPCPELTQRLWATGVPLVPASDAHETQDLGAFRYVAGVLDSLELARQVG